MRQSDQCTTIPPPPAESPRQPGTPHLHNRASSPPAIPAAAVPTKHTSHPSSTSKHCPPNALPPTDPSPPLTSSAPSSLTSAAAATAPTSPTASTPTSNCQPTPQTPSQPFGPSLSTPSDPQSPLGVRPFGDDFTSTTVLQTAPADPRVSRAALPVDYDQRAWWLLARMVVTVVVFAVVTSWLAVQITVMVGAKRLLVILAVSEAVFFLYYRRRYQMLNAQPPGHHAPHRHDPLAAFNRLIQVCQYFQHKMDARVYLSTWFCGADYRLIRRDNVADLIAYGFWYMSRKEMEAAGLGPLLRQCVTQLEAAFRISLPVGRQRGLRCMFHLWEPLRTIYRPLAFYLGTEILALLTKLILMALGASLRIDPASGLLVVMAGLQPYDKNGNSTTTAAIHKKHGDTEKRTRAVATAAAPMFDDGSANGSGNGSDKGCLSGGVGGGRYPLAAARAGAPHWEPSVAATAAAAAVAEAASDAKGRTSPFRSSDGGGGANASQPAPVVLLHGVGLGLLPYTNLIRCLLAARLPLLAVEYKHVSQRLCSIIPSADDIAARVVELMDSLGLPQGCVVAHSYGTFVASRLAQLHGHRLQSLALLDPVCFGMFMPHLLANFIYRQPRGPSLALWTKDMLFNFVSRDLHCAAALCRRFFWSDVNLWPQDIPGRTLVAIAGCDQLIHVHEVLDFIQHYAAKILYHPQHSHAQLLLDPHWQQQIVADISTMASSGCGSAGVQEVQRRLTTLPPTTCTATAATASPSPQPEQPLLHMAQALAAGPGVVRRVTTHTAAAVAGNTGSTSQRTAAAGAAAVGPLPPAVVQFGPFGRRDEEVAAEAPSVPASSSAASTGDWHVSSGVDRVQEEEEGPPNEEGTEEEEEDEDVAAFAAALSRQILEARGRMQQPPPPPPLVLPPSSSSSVLPSPPPAPQLQATMHPFPPASVTNDAAAAPRSSTAKDEEDGELGSNLTRPELAPEGPVSAGDAAAQAVGDVLIAESTYLRLEGGVEGGCEGGEGGVKGASSRVGGGGGVARTDSNLPRMLTGGTVRRRCTAAARLQHDSPCAAPATPASNPRHRDSTLMLMELAGAGLNRAVLLGPVIARPPLAGAAAAAENTNPLNHNTVIGPPIAAVSSATTTYLTSAITAALNDGNSGVGGVRHHVEPLSTPPPPPLSLRSLLALPSIREVAQEDTSGPCTPLGAPPPLLQQMESSPFASAFSGLSGCAIEVAAAGLKTGVVARRTMTR